MDRKKFIDYAEQHYKTVEYKKTDCQQFVENAANAAGYKFNSRGSNDMYRNFTCRKGLTSSFPLAAGDVVFKWREESSKLPERYHGDGIGDMYHVGILTAASDGKYTVCHSANSKENGKKDTFSTLGELSRTWQYAATLKNTETADDVAIAIGLLEEALSILKNF